MLNTSFSSYINNLNKSDHPEQVNDFYKKKSKPSADNLFVVLFKTFWIVLGKVIKDAAVELFFLLVFWLIIVKMSQGRDLIVSLFEPEGLYGGWRVFFILASVISYSLSMWIIPAFMFQLQERNSPRAQAFDNHLFFAHRVLPLIPFWLLAATLFNTGMVWFVVSSLLELLLLYRLNLTSADPSKRKTYRIAIITVGTILFIATACFIFWFQKEYFGVKVLFAVILYLLSILFFFIYYYVDEQILAEHNKEDDTTKTVYSKYRINTITYFVCLFIHIFVIAWIIRRPHHFNISPESILLYVFSAYVFIIDLFFYFFKISTTLRYIGTIIIVVLALAFATGKWKLNVTQYTIHENAAPSNFIGVRDDFNARYEALHDRILSDTSSDGYPIVLVAGEGGGSRAGLWFSQNLINYDYATHGRFRDYIFSISTVSGSSVGLSTLFAFWDKTRDSNNINERWKEVPGKIFANNYVGSSIRGLLLTDFLKSIIPFVHWEYDRNHTLQDEEAFTTEDAILNMDSNEDNKTMDIPDSAQLLKNDFMYYFYSSAKDGSQKYRDHTPITLINTTRSNDGRRGIFSSIRLRDSYFYEAIDIIGYLYEDTIYNAKGGFVCKGRKKTISLGEACNTSELFPIFSAPAYIDSLGSFVDGGYHENSGLKSTLDIYAQLKEKLTIDSSLKNKKYRIYIVYLKNGSAEKQLYKPMGSELILLQPLNALFNQPFGGSASYYEEKAKNIGETDPYAEFLPIVLRANNILDSTMSAVTDEKAKSSKMSKEQKIKIEKEILTDIADTVNRPGSNHPDTIIHFPLARWLSKTIIERIKLSASLKNEPDRLLALLKKVNGKDNFNIISSDEYNGYQLLRTQDSVIMAK